MAEVVGENGGGRPRLTRERVIQAALSVADSGGLGSLTIRSLAKELGAKPMSVYYHVANKEEILDGIVDVVFSEIELPAEPEPFPWLVRRFHLRTIAVSYKVRYGCRTKYERGGS